MGIKKPTPRMVSHIRRLLGRVHDVCEQDSGQDTIDDGRSTSPSQEFFDLTCHLVSLSCKELMIASGKLAVDGTRDMIREVPAVLDASMTITDAMNHKGRRLDRRQRVVNIGIKDGPKKHGARCRTPTQSCGP
jgi:hypothetical protein